MARKQLLNESRGPKEADNQISDVQRPLEYGSRNYVTTEDVGEALKKIGRTKAVGPYNIPIERKIERSGTAPVDEPEVSIDEAVVKSMTKLKYLELIIQRDGEIDGDVNHRIQAGWLKWRAATAVLYDMKFQRKLKGQFYRAAIRPALLYETECWHVKKMFEHKMEVTEMRMLRWMCGHTLIDRIKNQELRDKLGVAPIFGKMRENRLRWFGHVQRKTFVAPMRRVESIIVEGKRSRERPRRTWDEQIKVDLHELNLFVGLTRDRDMSPYLSRIGGLLWSRSPLWELATTILVAGWSPTATT
ncbi:uncharacterized protein LOC130810861 [Amaranthus tricolor]|uniref:uncharacterized protein LOC130810861 n=1 Tax=Amaranthus tricolor TaxID=29722 RepID=UPI00258D08B6|nr:uncharacterized protein LOC130810861 [Amaranthus tricolor]